MKIAKIKSVVLSEALRTRKFFTLSCYLSSFNRDNDCFITIWNEQQGMWDIRCAILDYISNEMESEQLFQFAGELIGRKAIDLNVVAKTTL